MPRTRKPLAAAESVRSLARKLKLTATEWPARTQQRRAVRAELEHHREPSAEMLGAVCQCVGELAGTLKPEYASALKRIEIDGLAMKAYAAEAGISSSNAAVRVFRARQALRKQVARSCGTCADHGCLDCTCDTAKRGCSEGHGQHGHGAGHSAA
jgi:DNA-directed RNA polymerase specialized sigma24 family protein